MSTFEEVRETFCQFEEFYLGKSVRALLKDHPHAAFEKDGQK
jgi:hypothetical protein